MKITQFEVVKGEKNGKQWHRLDIYFDAIDGQPLRVSTFLDSRTCRIIGLSDNDCKVVSVNSEKK